ncbi:MAG: hypothetical protein QXY22_03805 [Candidatus Nitrosotenuis sp.]
MRKAEKGKFLLVTGPRENEVLEELPILEKQEKLPANKTEVFRRGLHAVRQLAEVDERPLIELLTYRLDRASDRLGMEDVGEIKALSYVIYATIIAKRGVVGAEVFESIPLTCSNLDFIDKADRKKVVKSLEDLSTSIKTLILKDSVAYDKAIRHVGERPKGAHIPRI